MVLEVFLLKKINNVCKTFLGMLLLSVCLLLGTEYTYGVQNEADAGTVQGGDIQSAVANAEVFNGGSNAYTSSIENAEEAIYNGLKNFAASINIYSYDLTVDEMKEAFSVVVNDNPQLYYVANGYSYSYSGSTATVIYPDYKYMADEYKERQKLFDKEADKILSGIDNNWSDLEKIVYVYDYMCINYQYDTTYTKYGADDIFIEKTGVCNAYYLAYKYILNQLGIENATGRSYTMNHIWNQVKLNGKWYNVDVTWGDPISDKIGNARHTTMLKSDAAMLKNGYSNMINSYECSDTSYDDASWNSINSSFVFVNNQWYCISNTSLCKYDFESLSVGTPLYNLGKWYVSGSTGPYYTGAYSGLATYNNKLYFNTQKAILSYDTMTGNLETIFNASDSKLLYGSYMDDNIIYYGYAASPNNGVTVSGKYEIEKAVEELTISAKAEKSEVNVGSAVKITAEAAGGTGVYTYSFLMHNTDTDSWYRFPGFSANSTLEWTASSVGNREFFAEVKDGTGKVVRSAAVKVSVKAIGTELSITGLSTKYYTSVGDNITISGIAKGGSGQYTYSFLVHNKDTGSWYRYSEFISNDTLNWVAASIGNREFFVEVKDSAGKVVRSSAIDIVTKKEYVDLAIITKSSCENTSVGENIKLTAYAIGGDGNYTYSYLVYNKDTGSWYRYSGFTKSNTLEWTASSAGNREFYAEVKDSNGNVVRSKACVVITK